mmetsp:Transcript_36729/g.50990  ORF Transcript_36729/g.50990 Transcript_36729/m.50990 type:complete len:210 (+) Transcript_36729:233-862(+)
MTLSLFVAYVGGYASLVFLAVCLATGLYYLAELVEEYTMLTKKCITYAIYAVVGIHVALLVVDRLPLVCILCGIGSHAMYYTLLKKFPFIELASTSFICSVLALIVSHYVWIQHFIHGSRVSIEFVMGFFLICVWLVPFAFFISLAANESVLPMSASTSQSTDHGSTSGHTGKRSRGTLLSLMNFIRSTSDQVLPRVSPQFNKGKDRML